MDNECPNKTAMGAGWLLATTTTYYEDEDMNKEPFCITYLRAAAIIFSIFTLTEWFIE